jgi:hypothetical protein
MKPTLKKHGLIDTYANRNGIVLVYDRHNSHGKQFLEGVHRIEVPRPLGEARVIEFFLRQKRRTSEISPRVRSTCAIGCPSWPNRLSHSAINLPCPMAANAFQTRAQQARGVRKSARLGRKVGKIDFWLACFPERLFGRAGIAIRCRPTPMAPELTRTTLCPAARRRTTVSTMAESVDRSGWCVVSCTIDDVPASRRGSKVVIIRGRNGQYVMS